MFKVHFYMYCIYTFRYMRGHVTEKNSVQGFPPEIYTILIFYLKALSTKNNVATIIKIMFYPSHLTTISPIIIT